MKKNENGKRPQTGLEIAVIGMSGRFPGANDLQTFWENIKNGKESITFFTDPQLLEAGIDPETLKNPNYVKAKGYIEDLAFFDASFFRYTPHEAAVMDPQLRLFHQSAWHALEDAGYDPLAYPGLIGLYAGYTPNLLWKVGHLSQAGISGSEMFAVMNLNSDYFATRICYKLNLKGPGVTLNTACSTSLAAIHLACRGLLTGESDMALAGGVTVTLPWKSGYFYQEGMIMSPDGHCRPFAAEANGTTSGNGIAIVVLKRLVKAVKDGDNIYAVIKGTAINNDGNRKAGYIALSVEGQAQVIRAARRMAEVEPESITYIETHGIGTPMGDPLELEALRNAFSQTPRKQFCRLGFLKANVGHLDAAAGAAAFIKTVLALRHRLFPPAVNFTAPNPDMDFENSPFYVGKTLEPWPVGENPRRAGVSSFGIGGTNAHVILEEWTGPRDTDRETALQMEKYQVIPLSAKSKTALQRMSSDLALYLKENPDISLADAAYTLQAGRSAFNHRQLLVCTTKDEASAGLLSLASPSGGAGSPLLPVTAVEVEAPPVVFMFPGPGHQYVNMGLELYGQQPLFRQEMDRCFEILQRLSGYETKEILYPPESPRESDNDKRPDLHQPGIAPLAVFIFEYSLAKWLMQCGLEPRALAGDHLGEYTAACLAGVFSLEDALQLLILRGQLPREAGEKAKAFEDQVKQLTLHPPAIPLISTVTGQWLTPSDAANPRYWASHFGSTVPFSAALGELVQLENAIFLEVGPGTALATQAGQVAAEPLKHPVFSLVPAADREGPEMEFLLRQLGGLWLAGVSIDWGVLYGGAKGRRVPLPGYPFAKQAHGIEPPLLQLGLAAAASASTPAPPLTPNRPELKTPYAEPRDPVETMVARMWEELLGIRPIGIHDDLLELGVDSLKAITFVNRFKEQWGAIIHVTAIFSGPTVAELADYFNTHYQDRFTHPGAAPGIMTGGEKDLETAAKKMKNKLDAAVSENLLLLKESTVDTGNLFLLHEISGEIGAYIEFCQLLDTDFFCWGIQAGPLKNYKPQNRTIEEIAAIYVEKMKRIQPEGPYYLVTWSGGGPICFEMALQMEQRGDPLALLGFFDCRGPNARLNREFVEFTLETEKNYLKGFFAGTEIEEKLETLTHINQVWPMVLAVLKSNPAYQEGLERFIKQDRMLTLLNFAGQRIEDLLQYMNRSRTFSNAANQYLPARKLRTPLHFFEGVQAPQDTPVYWHEYCTKPVVWHRMSGDHYSIFKQPHVNEFAGVFSEVLRNLTQGDPLAAP